MSLIKGSSPKPENKSCRIFIRAALEVRRNCGVAYVFFLPFYVPQGKLVRDKKLVWACITNIANNAMSDWTLTLVVLRFIHYFSNYHISFLRSSNDLIFFSRKTNKKFREKRKKWKKSWNFLFIFIFFLLWFNLWLFCSECASCTTTGYICGLNIFYLVFCIFLW